MKRHLNVYPGGAAAVLEQNTINVRKLPKKFELPSRIIFGSNDYISRQSSTMKRARHAADFCIQCCRTIT